MWVKLISLIFLVQSKQNSSVGTPTINVDGSVCGPLNIASCGGVCKDSPGRWLRGFSRNLGSSYVLVAELWGILMATELAWDWKLPKVIMESDSLTVVKLINDGCVDNHLMATSVRNFRVWQARPWALVLFHTRGQRNVTADFLANLARSFDPGIHVLQDPPPRCYLLLRGDRSGVSFPRQVLV